MTVHARLFLLAEQVGILSTSYNEPHNGQTFPEFSSGVSVQFWSIKFHETESCFSC